MSEAAMPHLKPCPFCGDIPTGYAIYRLAWPSRATGHVLCESCGATGPKVEANDTPDAKSLPKWAPEANAAWNRRSL